MDDLLAQQVMQQQPQMVANAQPQQEAYNPFNAGIQRAIQSARASLAMTREQKEAALRNSMLAMGNHISQEPVQKGFWHNVGAVARSLGPAVVGYDQAEQQAMQQNQDLAQRLIAYRQHEEAKQAQEEERQWKQRLAEDQFNEQKRQNNLLHNFREAQLKEQTRYHDLMNEIQQNKNKDIYKNRNDLAENGLVEGKYQPFETKQDAANYSKKLQGANFVINHAQPLLDRYKAFEKKYENNLFRPFAPYGVGATSNYVKEFLADRMDDKDLKDETSGRSKIVSANGIFTREFERGVKGGILNQSTVDSYREEGLVPHEKDPPHIFQAKLEGMLEHAQRDKALAEKSLALKAHVDDIPYDLDMASSPQQPAIQADGTVLIIDQNGVLNNVRPEDVKTAGGQVVTVEPDGTVIMTDESGTQARVLLKNLKERLTAGAKLAK